MGTKKRTKTPSRTAATSALTTVCKKETQNSTTSPTTAPSDWSKEGETLFFVATDTNSSPMSMTKTRNPTKLHLFTRTVEIRSFPPPRNAGTAPETEGSGGFAGDDLKRLALALIYCSVGGEQEGGKPENYMWILFIPNVFAITERSIPILKGNIKQVPT